MYYKGTHEVTLNSNSANVIIKISDLIEDLFNKIAQSDLSRKQRPI